MTLCWRLTLGILALIAPLLLLMIAQDYHNLRSFLLEREGIRIRAQAKPIINKDLLHQPINDIRLRAIANQLATDLTSADTGAVIINRHGQIIGRHYSTIGEPTPPDLPQEWYTPALGGKLEQNYIVTDNDGNRILVALVPIPPRQKPLGVVVLSTSLEDNFRLIQHHVLLSITYSVILLPISSALVFVMVRSNLRRLERMIIVTKRIARGDWSQRVQLHHGSDEIGQLASSFDEMVNHLQAAFDAQAQSENRLRQFLADVSHELRTPLTTIGGYADLLLTGVGGVSEESRPLLKKMRREINRTSRLVKDLLLLARSDKAAMLELQVVDLSSLCAEVAEQVRLTMGRLTLQTTLSKKVVVRADPDRIEQVLLNVLDNAIRHTPENTQIDMHLESIAGKARITISDNGPGIPPDILDHVFERFRYGQRQSKGDRGLGLGLAIAKAIVEAHSGTIVAFNQLGGGACFRVELPLASQR